MTPTSTPEPAEDQSEFNPFSACSYDGVVGPFSNPFHPDAYDFDEEGCNAYYDTLDAAAGPDSTRKTDNES